MNVNMICIDFLLNRIQVLYVSECKDAIGINVINFNNLKPMHLRWRK